jgi:hypothetical protein
VDNVYGEDYILITKEDQIDWLNDCMISYNCELNKEDIDKYSIFVNELEKSLLFILLQ